MQSQKLEKRGIKEDAYRTLKGNAVILFLYILLQPDYAYNIAKNFDKMGPKLKGKKKYPWALARVSNVQPILKKLTEVRLLNKEEIKVKEAPWKKRVYYDVNMAIFDFSELYSNPEVEDVVSMLMSQYIQIMDGKTKGALLKSILKLKNPDYITVLLFYKQLLFSLVNNTSEPYMAEYKKALNKGCEATKNVWGTFPPEVRASIRALGVIRNYANAINNIILERSSKERGFDSLTFQVKLECVNCNSETKGAFGDYCELFAAKMKFLEQNRV